MYGYAHDRIVDRFEDWWRRENKGLPLMWVVARKDGQISPAPQVPADIAGKYTDFDYLLAKLRWQKENHVFLGDSFCSLGPNLGPGSLALYLGGEPRFAPDTVWYEPCIEDPETHPDLTFDPDNRWWKLHFDLVRRLREAAGSEARIDIPDLIENLDIYAAMRGPQDALYDLMDCPERVHHYVDQIENTYFTYYDALCDILRDDQGVTSYTAFGILGRGRVAKVQCDFSAMISPATFREYVKPALEKQTARLDHSLYHLDGPDAVRHVPALMEIEHLDALQFTCGAGQPDGSCKRWYEIYDQVAAAGKGLWIQLYDGNVRDWIRGAEELMTRYDKKRIYFHFDTMSMADAELLMNHACKHWE